MKNSPLFFGSSLQLRLALVAFAAVLFGAQLAAQVVINELSATSSERLLQYDSDGVPRLGAEAAWWEPEFTPRGWSTGSYPIGHSRSGLNTNLSAQMKGVTPSFYTRRVFTVSAADAASPDELQVTAEYDDGVIIYINGKEVARRNTGPENGYLYSDQAAYRAEDLETAVLDIGPASDLLVAGENLLAVAYHNGDVGDNNVPDLDAPAELDISLAISGGNSLVAAGGPCSYLVGLSEPSGGIFDPATLSAEIAVWGADGFDDSSWLTGEGPLGYDTDSPPDYVVGTDLVAMRGEQTSVYLRKTFNVAAGETALPAELILDWDDGYIAYLNGREISRGAMGAAGTRFTYDQIAANAHGASTDDGESMPARIITVGVPAGLMVEGENVLAFQLHNSAATSSDLYLSSEFRFASGGRVLITPTATWRYLIGTSEPGGDNDGPGDFSDWIELHNRGASAVDLSGWSLSDSDNNPLKWKIPSGTTIGADHYLLILADNLSALNGISSYLHAPFSLSSGGEDLILSDASGETVSSIDGGYPRQDVFHSYGLAAGGTDYGFFPRSTPGAENSGTHFTQGRADTPDFDVPGGFYPASVTLTLSTTTPGGVIYYTNDGSEPSLESTIYVAPIVVARVAENRGTVIRARTYANGMVPSRARTNTYLIDQRDELQERPALIFTGDPSEVFFRPHGIATISGGTRNGEGIWRPRDENDYNIPSWRGRAYERPMFMEFYYGDGTPGLRSAAGVRLSSSSFSRPRLRLSTTSLRRVPWANAATTKPSFNVYFRNDYGDSNIEHSFFPEDYPIDKFEQLRIRAGKNDIDDPFIRDEFMRRLFIEMGQEGSRGVFCSKYINGRLTGFFNLVERLREPFMRSHHNSDGSWDVHQVDDVPNGDGASWDAMRVLTTEVKNNPNDKAAWDAAMEVIDLDNWLDYWILNIYGATWDWPNNNWVAGKERSVSGKWRFYVWDAEGCFGFNGFKGVTYDTVGTDLLGGGKMPSCFSDLFPSPEFKLRFADRVNRLFFNGGALDDRESTSIPHQIKEECEEEFLPVKRGVTRRPEDTLNQTWFDNWVRSSNGRRSNLFNSSSNSSFRAKGLWPQTEPPEFAQHGGTVAPGSTLAIENPNASGTAYYTFDGSDPRLYGGGFGASAVAYSSPIAFPSGRTELNSRVRLSNGTWSPLATASFTVGTEEPTSSNMNIVEVMYYPADANTAEATAGFTSRTSFEFIRLQNVGSLPVDLAGARIAGGISFTFPEDGESVLPSGGSMLIVEDLEAFLARYGSGISDLIGGQYGGALSNTSDLITIVDREGTELHSFTYSRSTPWPTAARSGGKSLLLVQAGPDRDHSVPGNWTASAAIGGMPAGIPRQVSYSDWREFQFNQVETADDAYSGPDADPDGDGYSNFAEYVLGGNPEEPDSEVIAPEVSRVMVGNSEYFQLSADVVPGSGAAVNAQMSVDLNDWGATPVPVPMGAPTPNDDGSENYRFRSAEPVGSDTRRFFRLWIGSQ